MQSRRCWYYSQVTLSHTRRLSTMASIKFAHTTLSVMENFLQDSSDQDARGSPSTLPSTMKKGEELPRRQTAHEILEHKYEEACRPKVSGMSCKRASISEEHALASGNSYEFSRNSIPGSLSIIRGSVGESKHGPLKKLLMALPARIFPLWYFVVQCK